MSHRAPLPVQMESGVIKTDRVTLRSAKTLEEMTLELDGNTVMPFASPAPDNLGGWLRSLDGVGGPVPLHDGALTRAGWYVLDDSKSAIAGDWPVPRDRPDGYKDLYLFAPGKDPALALQDLSNLIGASPLLPYWAFGVWFSRYYAYQDADYRNTLIPTFRSENVPLDVLVVDTDWKSPNPWNGWSWNPALFPDGDSFLKWAASENLNVALNVHPSIDSADPKYPAVKDLAVVDAGHGEFGFDWGKREVADAYFALHSEGARIWWLDWCCESDAVSLTGVTPDAWINSLYASHSSGRGFAFSRIGGSYEGYAAINSAAPTGPWAERRSTVHFTGDTQPTWEVLAFEIAFTAAEGNLGLPYVTHDLGSFNGGHLPDDLYVRWVQFGTFQPIFRLHSNHGDRLPWDYTDPAKTIAENFMRLRESLVPYLYTLAKQAADTGLPMARSLYLHFPDESEAYSFANEYLLGENLLVAPIASADSTATVWFPPGTWIPFFGGAGVTGPTTQTITSPLDTIPVYVRAGGILPLAPPADHATFPDPLEVRVFAGADGHFSLYEDAGEGLDYQKGSFSRTQIDYSEATRELHIARTGQYSGMPAARGYLVRWIGDQTIEKTIDSTSSDVTVSF